MSHIFISHSSRDGRDPAQRLVAELEAAGRACWIAPRNMKPAVPFPEQIVTAISDSLGLVLLLTTEANQSLDVLQEVVQAHHERKLIAAVTFSGTEPSKNLIYYLRVRQWLAWTDAKAVAAALGKVFAQLDTAGVGSGSGGGGPEFSEAEGLSDISAGEFGGMGGSASMGGAAGPRRTPPRDHHVRLDIDLQDAYHGATRTVDLKRAAIGSNGTLGQRTHTVRVAIPAGVTEGQLLRLAGQGESAGGRAGDLYLEVHIRPDPLYHLEGRDVTLTLPVTQSDAALGARVSVPTLGGTVDVKVPAGAQSGQRLRLRGLGMPGIGGAAAGNLYMQLKVVPLTQEPNEGPELVMIPPGRFLMGSPDGEEGHSDSERPVHPVTIGYPFAVGKYPVTRGQWRQFAKATGYESERWLYPGFRQEDSHPVVNISWQDAADYAAWLSKKTGHVYRLLSEAEYEYVNRAGSQTAYFWGEKFDDMRLYTQQRTACELQGTWPVGCFKANAFGLHDTSGHVWCWTRDRWHSNYLGAPADGSAWEEGTEAGRVVRGGSWNNFPRNLRSANRDWFGNDDGRIYVGFRVARTVCAISPDGRSPC